MKKIVIIIMLFTLILSMLGGCFRIPKNFIPKPSASQSSGSENNTTSDVQTPDAQTTDNSNSEATTDLTSLKPAGNPSEGFSNYSTYKSNAFDRVTTASEKSDSLSVMVSMSFLGVTMIDLSLIPLTMLVGDMKTSEAAMGILFKDVKITGSGNDYTITYVDSDGGTIKQTCKYDPGKDQMTSTMYDADGKIAIFFEYVFLGDAYAAQYYYPQDDKYQVIRAYFDKDNIAAFGVLTASDIPASILGKSGFNADFVKNDESYLVLKDGKLTVLDKGTTTTN